LGRGIDLETLDIDFNSLAAMRFNQEAQRWSKQLQEESVAGYIRTLAADISSRKVDDISLISVEKYLMYGVLLQNHALHNK